MTHFGEIVPRLPAADLPRTIDFYRRLLAFEIDVAWPDPDPTFVILRRDRMRLSFFTPNELQPGPPGYVELYIEVVGIEDLHARLAREIPIEWGPEVYTYGRREFAVRDPDRYLLIFTEETSDPPTTSEPG